MILHALRYLLMCRKGGLGIPYQICENIHGHFPGVCKKVPYQIPINLKLDHFCQRWDFAGTETPSTRRRWNHAPNQVSFVCASLQTSVIRFGASREQWVLTTHVVKVLISTTAQKFPTPPPFWKMGSSDHSLDLMYSHNQTLNSMS